MHCSTGVRVLIHSLGLATLTIILNRVRIVLMKRLLPAVAVLALGSLVAGCGAFSDSARSGDGGEGGGPQVAAAFYPLEFVATRVAGQYAEVAGLTSPGTEPHDLELSINQTAAVGDADVVLFEHGFQPAIDDAVDQHADGVLVDAEQVLELRSVEEHEEEATDEHGDEHGHDHGDLDPHFWHDPLLMADYGDAVADALAEADEAHAEDYRANAAALRSDLESLDEDFTTGLAGCERHEVVVAHDAFGYLTRYGLEFESIAGLTPDAEPNPAELAELAEHIREHQVTTVFSERLVSPKLAESLAKDAGVAVGVLDPIEGLSQETSDEDYLSLMRANLAALREANGCQ